MSNLDVMVELSTVALEADFRASHDPPAAIAAAPRLARSIGDTATDSLLY